MVAMNTAERVQKHRLNKIEHGFKRVHKWIFDIESPAIQEMLLLDLANYKITQDEAEWNEFASEQLENLEGWV